MNYSRENKFSQLYRSGQSCGLAICLKLCVLFILTVAAASSSRGQQPKPSNSGDLSRFRYIYDWNIFDPRRVGPRTYTPPPPVVDRFWLSGTMSYSKGLFAVFDGTQANLHQVLEKGGKIAGYSVSEIGQDSVTLTLGTNTVKLTMEEQMSHSQDGKWTLVQGYGGSSYSSSSYAGDSSSYSSGSERGNRRRRAEYGGGRNEFDTGGPSQYSTPVESSSSPGSDTGGNDIIARMRRARAAALGGSAGPDNGPGQPDGSGPQMDQGPGTPPDGAPPTTTPPDTANPTTPPTGPGGTPNGPQ